MISNNVILNGPYLMSPTTNSMTVAWETGIQIDTNLFYGINGAVNKKAEVCIHKETPCKENPNGNFIYSAFISNLGSNTLYNYKIKLKSGEEVCGTFKTLDVNPHNINILTISDSHLFYINEQFTNVVLNSKPDFIIHVGDIPFGTGYQREQYENNWFKKVPEVLKRFPVIYVHGNHDDGPFFNDFFTIPQSKVYKCDNTGRTFSFDYGRIHFIMIDSDSWGLFEMNAVNSGLPVDDETKKIKNDTLDWVVNDLRSEQAKTADWRVMVLHHPYTDEFNNKYIVPIAEEYNANLVLSGHLHYYIKNISINPKIGAKTVYIAQGSAQDAESKLDLGESNNRLLTEFPEVVALGKENYGYITIMGNMLKYQTFGFNKSERILVDEVILENKEPDVIISEIKVDALDNFGHIRINGKAKNIGHGIAAVKISVKDNDDEHIINLFGQKGKERVIALNYNEEKSFTAIYNIKVPGKHQLCVEGVIENVTVSEDGKLKFENMKVKVGNGGNANLLASSVEVTNNLNYKVQVPIKLFIDKSNVETKLVSLQGHEKKIIEFYYKFLHGGDHCVRVENMEEKEVKIQGAIRVIPKIKDLSGNGNDAFLRGTPRVIQESDKVIVCLDKYDDYLEIPDSPSLHVEEGFTGIVSASVDRLAKDTEMGHNPLMVKGKSIGWGATYLLRMAIERAGGLKWGTCHDITEYAWQGGNVNLNKFTQYTAAFSKISGGTSYCNTDKVASIPGIKSDAEFRNWEGEPLFVGYSYIGHIIKEIDRPKYFTHLPAKISQVRFYTTKLSDEENRYICENPTQIGPNNKDLVVWLDFNNIESSGSHITEWRRPAAFKPSYKTEKRCWNFNELKVKAAVPGKTSIKATIEVSDDGNLVKGSKSIFIEDGSSNINLIGLDKGQYIRIITKFTAQVDNEGTFIPELFEYEINASIENTFTKMIWSTRSDWEKGKFMGQVGFEPVDRLKVFDEYTDVIHG